MSSFKVNIEVDALPGWSLKINRKSFESVMPLWGPFIRLRVCVSSNMGTYVCVRLGPGMCVKKSLQIANPLPTCIKYKSRDYRAKSSRENLRRTRTHPPECARGVCVCHWQVSHNFHGLHSGKESKKPDNFPRIWQKDVYFIAAFFGLVTFFLFYFLF